MPISVNTTLGLKLPTDPRWVNLTQYSIADILTDHAYCEQKAALTGIALIQKNWDKEELVEKITPLVTEEWGHFRIVIKELKKRNLPLGMPRKDDYVNALRSHLQKGGSRDDYFLDHILLSALIEARSCERFRVLSLGLADTYLKKFYWKFMVSEAGHYKLFIDLAKRYISPKKVTARWKEWLLIEKEILKTIEVRGDRIH